MDDPLSGRILQDRYRVSEKLAAGGMGVVYRGERLQLGRPVAIKFLRAFAAADEQALKRFEIEARATSRLSHPNCVAILDFGVDDAVPYLVLEFVTGRPVRGPVSAGRALHIVRQVLAGLAHAHGQGIIHRDIKPDNIVISEVTGVGLQVRILDFGMAKLLDAGGTSLTQGFAIGTPAYMSPEQTLSDPVDARSDLYSTGVLLFELLAGRKPFQADDLRELLGMHRMTPAPRLRSLMPSCSPELDEAVAKALAKSPADRWQTAAEMSRALDATPEAKANRVVPGAVPSKATVELTAGDLMTVAQKPPEKPRSLLPWLGLAGVAAVAIAAAVVLRPEAPPVENEPPPPPTAFPEEPVGPPPEPLVASKDDPPEVTEAVAQANSGDWRGAVKKLEQLRKRYRDNAAIPYALGHLYMSKLWGQEAFAAYKEAVDKNPAYRTDPVLIRDAVRSLVSDSHAWRGAEFIRREIGQAAIPYLQEVQDSKATRVRYHARRLLAELAR